MAMGVNNGPMHPKEQFFYDCIFDFVRKERNVLELPGAELFEILSLSNLSKEILIEIWKTVKNNQLGGLTREQLYLM